MKNHFTHLIAFTAIILSTVLVTGCANSITSNLENPKGSVSFSINRSAAESIRQADSSQVLIAEISLSGQHEETKEIEVKADAKASFAEIPVGSIIYAKARVYSRALPEKTLYQGQSEEITVSEGENKIKLTLTKTADGTEDSGSSGNTEKTDDTESQENQGSSETPASGGSEQNQPNGQGGQGGGTEQVTPNNQDGGAGQGSGSSQGPGGTTEQSEQNAPTEPSTPTTPEEQEEQEEPSTPEFTSTSSTISHATDNPLTLSCSTTRIQKGTATTIEIQLDNDQIPAESVNWNLTLWDADIQITNPDFVTTNANSITLTIPYPGNYTIKARASYLGITYDSEFQITCED